MKQLCVQLKQVNFAYPGHELILKNINLEIREGEFAVIFGPNGAAKTTLLKIISGLLKPESGLVNLNTSSLGYLPQKTYLNNSFPATVEEVLTYTSEKNSLFKDFLLHELGLSEKHRALLKTLSGGQLQRVHLARILSNNPQLLILDEPTNNLDQQGIEKLFRLLNKLHQQNKTIILVTHDLTPLLGTEANFYLLNQKKICKLNTRDVI
ncbi:MAG TPA: metal ABC transporter ATP-binding protein [Clostridia bacterium]|jgi:zinc transport system ATP-binding protein|nr:metal ABC transporter ATP-binding protein [Clostridia bacterium]